VELLFRYNANSFSLENFAKAVADEFLEGRVCANGAVAKTGSANEFAVITALKSPNEVTKAAVREAVREVVREGWRAAAPRGEIRFNVLEKCIA
jgi:hypothetical protein